MFFPTWAHSVPPLKDFKKSLLKKKEIQSHSDVSLTETAGISTVLIRAEFYCIQTSGSIKEREPLSKPEDQMNRLIKYHHVGSLRQEDLQPLPSCHGWKQEEACRNCGHTNSMVAQDVRVSFSMTPATSSFSAKSSVSFVKGDVCRELSIWLLLLQVPPPKVRGVVAPA